MKETTRKLAAAAAALMMLTMLPAGAENADAAVPAEEQQGRGFGKGERPEGRPERNRPDEAVEETEEAETEPEETEAIEKTAADSMDFDATVISEANLAVIAPVGGRVASVEARVGGLVQAGDVLAVLETAKVYAPQSGTVAAVFGAAGDSVSAVCERYGAVVCIEPTEGRYTISADTSNAYSNSDNLLIHTGETVWLKCYSDGDHTGVGFVSSVSGSSYTVEVTEGEFKVGETVTVFRSEGRESASRLGRGTCARGNDVNVGSGENGIAVMHVQAGDAVEKGDLLYETVNGSYSAYYCTGAELRASADGILSEMNLHVGDSVNADSVIARVEPVNTLMMQIDVNEADLPFISEGDAAEIRLNWDDGAVRYDGTVCFVSRTAQAGGEAVYTAYVQFAPDESVRLGMTGTCTVFHTSR